MIQCEDQIIREFSPQKLALSNAVVRPLLICGYCGPTGWAKKSELQTNDHNSVKSQPIYKIFSPEDSLVNL